LGGEVRLLADNQIADNATVALSGDGAVLNLNGRSDTIGALNMEGGTVLIGGGTLTLNGDVTAKAVQITKGTFTPASINGSLLQLNGVRFFTVNGQPGSNTDLLVQTQVRGGTLIKEGAGVMELDTGGTGEVGNPVLASVRAGTLLLDRGLDGNVTVRNNG